MEDDLEAELLAVTSNPTNQNTQEYEEELSENFYSGDSESDVGELEEYEEKFEENHEEAERDSDDEFVPNKSSKRKNSTGKGKKRGKDSKQDRFSPSTSPSLKRPRPPSHLKKSSRRSRHVEEQRIFYEDGYDEYGFGDDKDVSRLMGLSEVEREAILAERLERREQLKLEKDIKRRIGEQAEDTSPTAEHSQLSERPRRESEKSRKKRAALESLAIQKGKQRGLHSYYQDLSFSEESSLSGDISEGEEVSQHTMDRRQLKKDFEERRRPIMYSDIVSEAGRTTPMFFRRQMLEMFLSKPFFDKMIVGMFARLSVGTAPDNPNIPVYRLVRIAGIHEREPRYKVGGQYTNKRIICLFGSVKGEFSIERFSNKHPTEAEFDRWFKQMMNDRETIPTKDDVNYLISLSLDYRKGNIQVSDEELQKHIEKFEKLNPERVNYVAKKNEILTQITFLRDNGASAAEIADYERKLVEIERLEAKYHRRRLEDMVDDRMKSLARKSKEENARMDSERIEKQISKDRLPSELNPFSRRTSRGNTSYFTIDRKGSELDLSQSLQNKEEDFKENAAIEAALKMVDHPKEDAVDSVNPVEIAETVNVSLDDLFDDTF
ncbi:RNA polymerase-associated protein RTF1-like protein [Galdieria sulphuraria]|uniref:RNA polymerase-associated protein RTF1-like protein n=1 Tax=Galdieria sulphuraria TaxID=130081 RepID=M2Y7C4_GALSU|nr:RNA polymerase-associated protein RTF1-like protein [Galdieria sulphuraria]EME31739.1 RNA polymerase-associated protein RTF1-like protein [Galdieria sulphuraria]|eukprot:XP_005708259.1 RNA polymerase-associated protein RTF1-like protein [Galdieria sulphuraria]